MSEEEAIENLRKQLFNTREASECGLATKGEFKEEIEAIETVLNMLEDNKQRIRRLCKESNQLFNEKEKLGKELAETTANEYKYDSIISELLDEIEEKDKIIDRIKQEYEKQCNLFKSKNQKETDFSLLYFCEELLNL